jgi:adenylate cyclase
MIAEMCTKTTDLESRLEFEYEIPINDALQMENMRIGYLISKTRYHIIDEFNQQWEIDIFDDNNAGLVIAELEIPFVSTKIQLPPWVSTEVTHNHKFYNAWLATCPFEYWINRDEILGELNDGSR